eukprot:CAMPEP_0117680650 /NCGR_PEP_ID=MMETSP0804-20121206/18484_1 /TAXON_ID=1074897 /ORGANISM="Tetraselmis astigmatica, Strain CCMP880" /LENGTH=410 /DNA_ID=CAMNT_0005490199 /DNA_START=81 /DNA_END=1313 /DNA_ORIENTATION=+
MSVFGAPSTPAFGASSPPAFGASSTPAFGTSSTPSFGVSAAPAFGGGFGATPIPAFGATSTPGFGASQAAPAFGASTPAFGAASTPSLFGTASASTSLFGAAPASQSPSLFGTPTGAFGPTLANASLLSGSSPGMFGAATASQMAPSMFGGAAPGTAPMGGNEAAMRELQAIDEAYRAGAPHSAFTHFLLNVVDNPAQRVKPPHVDGHKWREAMKQAAVETHSGRLWPVQATGFGDLLDRRAAQDAAIKENDERLAALRSAVRQISRKHELDIQERKQGIVRRHQELCHRLLRVTRWIDGAEGRLASSMGASQGCDISEYHRWIAAIEAAVAPSSAGGLQRQVEALAAAVRLRVGGAAQHASSTKVGMDEDSLRQMHVLLEKHMAAVRKLQEILVRDQRDMDILARAELQ